MFSSTEENDTRLFIDQKFYHKKSNFILHGPLCARLSYTFEPLLVNLEALRLVQWCERRLAANATTREKGGRDLAINLKISKKAQKMNIMFDYIRVQNVNNTLVYFRDRNQSLKRHNSP